MTDLPPPQDQRRLEALLDDASSHALDMNRRAVQASLDAGKERVQYFEKIALACAGTIALVVSFVGSHPGHLQPPWLLRCSLITLVLAMMAAMYRNWRFPFYVMANHRRQELVAQRDKQRARRDLIVAFQTVAIENGELIDVNQWLAEFKKGEEICDDSIAKIKKQEDSASICTKRAEYAALVLTVAGMIMLIALAWENF